MLSRALAAASPQRRPAQGRQTEVTQTAAPADPYPDLGHGRQRPFALPPLPYRENALSPVISARTVNFHYKQHHAGYATRLNQLLVGHPLAGESLITIIRESSGSPARTALFNNAAQLWNHSFYWQCLTPRGGVLPDGPLSEAINRSFGSFAGFRERLLAAATGQFASGWAWLCAEGNRLTVRRTANADTPVQIAGVTPLLTIDVWEHAYYLDYQHRRADHAGLVIDRLFNWRFATSNYQAHERHQGRGETVRPTTVSHAPAPAPAPAEPPPTALPLYRVPETRSASLSRLARSR